MIQDLNSISVYEYIVATNPMKAASFLASKGFTSSGGDGAMRAYQNAPALLGNNLLDRLASPNIPDTNKAGALFVVKDSANNLQKYVSSGGEPALKEVMIALHPDKEAIVSALSKSKKSKADGDTLNCCGKINADGVFACDGSNGCDGSCGHKYANTVPMPPKREETVLQPQGPLTVQTDYTNVMVFGLLLIGIIVMMKNS